MRRNLSKRPQTSTCPRQGAGGEAVFILHCPDVPPELRESYGFKLSELNAIETEIGDRLAALCVEWSNHHGHY